MTATELHPTGPAEPDQASIGGYRFALTCPRCGGALIHVTSGTPGLDTRAVARCGPCRRHWCVVVTLTDVTAELGRPSAVPGVRHGTTGCYARGCRHPDCTTAAAMYQRERRAGQRHAGAA